MKKITVLYYLFLSLIFTPAAAQDYDLIDYNINDKPTYGIKIKTRIPFQNGGSMPTVRIEGYNYGMAQPVGLDIVWYVYHDRFIHAAISSWGAYTPPIYLSNEDGLITIFIDDRPYFMRFHVSAYAKGLFNEDSSSFSGWTVINNDSIGGSNRVLIPYKNAFAGKVLIDGNVLIGKTSQSNTSYKLDVNGNIRANKVVVNTTGADYVFDTTYYLTPLDSLNNYIKRHKHLPGIPSAEQMEKEGLNIGATYTKLLEKVEEMTKYIFELKKEIVKQKNKLERQRQLIQSQQGQIINIKQLLKEKNNKYK